MHIFFRDGEYCRFVAALESSNLAFFHSIGLSYYVALLSRSNNVSFR